jgi:hypothetical protein
VDSFLIEIGFRIYRKKIHEKKLDPETILMYTKQVLGVPDAK